MSERNKQKQRVCSHCKQHVISTAAEIKTHAEKCKKEHDDKQT